MMAAMNRNEKASSPGASSTASRSSPARHAWLFTFLLSAVIVWAVGASAEIYFYPRLIYNNGFGKAILAKGFGEGPVPVNTLYTEPQTLFAQPLAAQFASSSNLMMTGVNRDTLLIAGWLDLSKGAQVLQVPDMGSRYYSVQFTDPNHGTDFAYVGTRATGTKAGNYLISGPNWKGQEPNGMTQISSPNDSVLVIGRVLVYTGSDLPTAYGLAKQIQLTPLSKE
jgi:hypothetical protein